MASKNDVSICKSRSAYVCNKMMIGWMQSLLEIIHNEGLSGIKKSINRGSYKIPGVECISAQT